MGCRECLYIPMFDPNSEVCVFHIPVNEDNTIVEPFVPEDGKQYCFTTATGNWIARRNGTYFVSSNSGKSSTMLPVALALRRMGKSIAQVALSGKASLNLTEITHQEGKTIHRLLEYHPRITDSVDDKGTDGDGLSKFDGEIVTEDGVIKRDPDKKTYSTFFYGKDNQLPVDAVILDEVSMVGGGLFLSLLEAIPDKAKLILIGDEGQLEAIGYCNVLYDIRKAGNSIIPSYRLTQILRQSAKSGIISDSAKVYRKEQFIKPSFTGAEIHGELQDFKIVATADAPQTRTMVLKEYSRIIGLPDVDVSDVIVATQKRAAGILSSLKICCFGSPVLTAIFQQ